MTESELSSRTIRGQAYTLQEFQTKYGLQKARAKALFDRFGPGSNDLDILMTTLEKRARREPLLTVDFHEGLPSVSQL